MSETNQTLIQQFYTSFQASRSDLTSRLESLKSEGSPSADVLNEITLEISQLRKKLTDAVAYLPSYDQRQYESHIKAIEKLLSEIRASSSSKSKFSFKRKQPVQSPSPVVAAPSIMPADTKLSLSAPQSSGRILSGRSNEYLTTSSLPTSSTASDLTLTNLDHCVVNLVNAGLVDVDQQTKITALHVRDVSNSIVILPSTIDGSAMFHNITKCTIVLGCHQFRMHTSNQVHVYLAISSSPIIEHCSNISFASYPAVLCNNGREREMASKASNHDSVQDFSHIRPTPSPNWNILRTEMQVKDSDWPVSPVGDKIENILSLLLPH
ncbi:hypothetical protein QCA50_018311 [Cerrena zonata]|uniref:C-CAP/cofactor C-like domain-containing protein n=1 Tax=Cerrena zonata TaxID=2478898 RepID=A0AAW0FKL5_9APHY